ncbi:PAS domain-containing protein [Fulvimarina sp. MAC8]|uniref:sensor histidine kinase n=1 Tax=Fulvimarina sp. MAC8 TaxID=3162874 RepID=UPI0032F043AD
MNAFDFERQFQALPQPHAVFSRELKFIAVNAALEASTGMTASDLVGRQIFEVFPNSGVSGERLRASLQRVLETGERSSIAFLRYDIPGSDGAEGGFLRRYWSLTYSPMLDGTGRTEFILATIVDVTQLAEENAADMGLADSASGMDTSGEAQVELAGSFPAERQQEIAAFSRLFRQAPGMFAVLEGRDLRFSFVNDSFLKFASDRTVIGRSFFDVLPELQDQGVPELARLALDGGGVVIGETVHMEMRRSANDEPGSERFFDFTFSPMTDNTGAVVGLFFQGVDRTEFMRATLRHRILVDELNHRVKNTLSTVQAMARQSFRSAADPEEARFAFEARIMALSQAHNLLSARRWESAGLTTLLHQELADLSTDDVSIAGPNVLLGSKTAIALALVFHELASNAARYGACASGEGHLSVEWSCEARGNDRILRFEWSETVSDVDSRGLQPGYGIRVLKRIIEGELGGDLSIELRDRGLQCRFEIVLTGAGEFETSVA